MARNWGIPVSTLDQIRAKLFERVTVGTEETYILKPEARKHLDLIEHIRRLQYDEARAIEHNLRVRASKNEEVDPIDELNINESTRIALKDLRKKLGGVDWVAFITMIYDESTPVIDIVKTFPGLLRGPMSASTWRKVLTQEPVSHLSTRGQIHVPGSERRTA